MTIEFKEEPLVQGVYLRTEGNCFRYSIRPATCLTTFPLFGNLHLIYSNKTLENPIEDIVAILFAQKERYKRFKKGLEVIQGSSREKDYKLDVFKEIIKISRSVFFKEQSARFTLVESCLNKQIEEETRLNLVKQPGSGFYDFNPGYLRVRSAVTRLHGAVLDAEYCFDKTMVGKGIKAEEKFGKEPDVESSLDKAEKLLERLCRQESKQNVLGELEKWRKMSLEDIQRNASNDAARIFERIENAKR
ncbi:MAG: hypothetical protein KKA62_03565 [Nanoarchaeota archaeon]|nr:hypothetical protein [Nanoarchaeota archaeon]MBU1643784.1 hypothetical protein [Nanoarchaeota archaeon]MBU1977004.1 hypothetical protein [Nanoarchaeota archaeon]